MLEDVLRDVVGTRFVPGGNAALARVHVAVGQNVHVVVVACVGEVGIEVLEVEV